MTNEQTALAKVISLIHSECNRVADINSSYHDGIYEGLLIVLRHITTDGLLQYEREQMIESRLSVIKENTLWDALTEESRNDYVKQATDYFNQNYIQDGK